MLQTVHRHMSRALSSERETPPASGCDGDIDAAASQMLYSSSRLAPAGVELRRLTMEERRVVLAQPRPGPASTQPEQIAPLDESLAAIERSGAYGDAFQLEAARLAAGSSGTALGGSTWLTLYAGQASKAGIHRGVRFGHFADEGEAGTPLLKSDHHRPIWATVVCLAGLALVGVLARAGFSSVLDVPQPPSLASYPPLSPSYSRLPTPASESRLLPSEQSIRRTVAFDDNWRFFRGDDPQFRDRRCSASQCPVPSLARDMSKSPSCGLGFCAPTFDDSGWRLLDVPHDWSSEDLPPRTEDAHTPVLTVRNGTWLFAQGDRPDWSASSVDESAFTQVEVPSDWRDAPMNYKAKNAVGWYRRRLDNVVPAHVAATNLVLAIGSVAAEDHTYLNGVLLGHSGSRNPTCDDYIRFRAYTVPPGLLKPRGNVVAVRVWSQGGADYPGGLFDHPTLQNGDRTRNGPFDVAVSPGAKHTGYAVGGVGWYRKAFASPSGGPDRRVSLTFDGCYMNCELWLNGEHLLFHPFGYTTFSVDITDALRAAGEQNVLAVRISNLGTSSRWYSGSGIFRHVHLTVTDATHIKHWGVAINPQLAADFAAARVNVTVTGENDGQVPTTAAIRVVFHWPEGSVRLPSEPAASDAKLIPPGASATFSVVGVLLQPMLWGVRSPSMYVAAVELVVSDAGGPDRVADRVDVRFGVRKVEWGSKLGFRLNGESLKLRGGCLHHDNGPLGAAAIDRAEERRVEILKRNGCYNSYRPLDVTHTEQNTQTCVN